MDLMKDNIIPSGNNEEKEGVDEENHLLYYCDLCCSKIKDLPSSDFHIPQRFCADSLPSLREHLLVYFILTKLLKVSKEQYFEAVSAPALETLVFRPKFCGNCQEIINEALETHIQLLDLQRKISELGETLSTKLQEKKGKCGKKRRTVTSYFQTILEQTRCADDNHEEKNIKVKVKQEQREEDPEYFVDSFNDFDESSNVSPPPSVHSSKDDNHLLSVPSVDEDTRDSDTDNEWPLENIADYEHEECHEDKIPGPEPSFICEICNAAFQRPLNLRRHMKAHEESTQLHDNKYDCPKCKYPAISESKLRYHLAKIHKMKLGRSNGYDEESTGKSEDLGNEDGKSKLILITEVAHGNGDDENFPCKLCDTVYQRQLGYRRHMEAHRLSKQLHGSKYDCPRCKYPCLSENKLRFHLAKIHKINDENQKVTQKPKKKKKVILDSDDSDVNVSDEGEAEEKPISNYSCNSCDAVYQRRLGYRRHLQAHKLSTQLHKNKYDCPECKFPALSEFKLKYHLSIKHNSKENNTCSICGFQGERRYLYEKHMLKKHGVRVWKPMTDPTHEETVAGDCTDTDPTYPCDKCTMIYKSDRGIREHKKDHAWSEENDHKFDCDQCGYPARSDRVLRTHKTKYHPSERTLQCTVCDFTATTKVKLSSHMLHKHGGETRRSYSKVRIRNRSKWLRNLKNGKFVCEICQVGYSHSETLKKHVKFHEKTKREFGGLWDCKKCGYPTSSEDTLKKHMTAVHNREHLRCERCQKGFTKASNLKMHMRTHKRSDRYLNPTTGFYQCKYCDFQSKVMQGILNHKKTHAEENQPRTTIPGKLGEVDGDFDVLEEVHFCPHCGISFNREAAVKQHIRQKHEGVYKFYCEFCSKGYGDIRNLNEHLATHDKNRVISREHVCDVCGADYIHHRSLLTHIAKYHGIDGMKARVTTNKMHKCRWCNKEFQYKSMLAKHLPTEHADLYKFCCDLCTKSYISGSSLRLHKEIVHKIGSSSESKVGGNKTATAHCEYCGKEFAHRHHVICHYKFCAAKRQNKYYTSANVQGQSTSQKLFKAE